MKLICRCPIDVLQTTDAVDDFVSGWSGAQATAYKLEPHLGERLAAPADGADAVPGGLVMLWVASQRHARELVSEARSALGCTETFTVTEHVVVDHHTPTAVARLGFIRRREGLTHQQFADHWTGVHAPLVMAHQPLFSRYVANVADPSSGWDGVVEQHFIDAATWAEHDRRIVAERAEVRNDITRFIDSMTQFAAVALG